MPPSVTRFHYVDVLRGLAAIIVLICHYRFFFSMEVQDWRYNAPLPLYSFLWPVYEYGGVAVQMFWTLSGFVFALAYGARGKNMSTRTFLVHRIARLYPLHLLTLCVMALLQMVSLSIYGRYTVEGNNDLNHFLLHLFFASNWFTMEGSFNGPIWSVSVEVLIYAAFVLYLKRWGLNLVGALGLAGGGLTLALFTGSPVAECLGLFFTGVVSFMLAPRMGKWLLPLTVIALVAVVGMALALSSLGYGTHTLLAYLGTPALLGFFIALDLRLPPLSPSWHWLGMSTYSIYLWHLPIIVISKIALGSDVPRALESPFALLSYCIVVIGLAVLSYKWIEAPAQRWVRTRGGRILGLERTPSPSMGTLSSEPSRDRSIGRQHDTVPH